MIGTAIRIAIAITGFASGLNPFARVSDDGVSRSTDDNVERIVD
jgi:hypothetical protein